MPSKNAISYILTILIILIILTVILHDILLIKLYYNHHIISNIK